MAQCGRAFRDFMPVPVSVTPMTTYWPGDNSGIEPEVILIRRDVHCFNCKLAPVGHGVAGIDSEIEDRGFKMVGVDLDRP